jgi:prolyl-tRNA editing enzyme YbaK/EbsC (Cys-tRNA(Pro) deacylase)
MSEETGPRTGQLPRAAQRVRTALETLGLESDIRVLPDSTRTAPEAAAAVGCELGAIVKSLIFRGAGSGDPVLVLVSGDNRADETRVAEELGEDIERADADFVRARTGYAIGGVPPVGHPAPLATLVDEDLLRFDVVWAAAGTPRAVFPVGPRALAGAAGGRLVALAAG